jgi:hypothetical protein
VHQFWVVSHHSLVVASYPPCPFPHCAPCHRYRHSTCNPPHEQLLVGLEAGGALSSVVCHSFVVVCHMSFIRRCLSLFGRHRLFVIICCVSFVHCHLLCVVCLLLSVIIHSLSSVVVRLFIIIRHRRLVSIIPTYPPCEQWLAAAGGRG